MDIDVTELNLMCLCSAQPLLTQVKRTLSISEEMNAKPKFPAISREFCRSKKRKHSAQASESNAIHFGGVLQK